MAEETHINRDEDEKLVNLCKKGDMDAFEALVRKHQKRVFNVAYRMVGSYDEASDIAQEAFIAVYRGIKKFEGRAKFSTWVYTITINTAKNRLSQLKARRAREPASIEDPIRTAGGEIHAEPRSKEPSALDMLETREFEERVKECIDALDTDFREVIVLRDMQGLTYGEICEVLGVPQGTVKSRLFRARDSLKECLKKVMGNS
ncbi:MAG: sigma-70 family RNA polymerase sigma factor [Deltaproteobacteria bacterium]|nr:sigma-70 family RNA polymerase sigma factor [Deltaproteobacteria bacterium]